MCSGAMAQRDFYKSYHFTRADTLRGMLRPERTCYDVTFYDLHLRIDPLPPLAGRMGLHSLQGHGTV